MNAFMPPVLIAGIGLVTIFVFGFLEPFVDAWPLPWIAALATAIATILLAARASIGVKAPVVGGFVGTLIMLAFMEGRYLAFITGWNGLEADEFISATGEGPSEGMQALVLAWSLLVGIPLSLVGAGLGWIASRWAPTEQGSRSASPHG